MKLNVGKCKVMHFGAKNSRAQYCIGDKFLGSSECERDLGVMVSCDLRWKTQVRSAIAKANRMLGLLKRTFVSREVGLWTRLYCSLVRPHLEFAIQVWNPSAEGDIQLIESVQKRASRIPLSLRGLSYEERLSVMGITTLRERRKRGDLVGIFKVVRCEEPINWVKSPEIKSSILSERRCGAIRGNSLRLVRESFPSKKKNDFANFDYPKA